ncbi:ABC transporter substrate-binding protein [Roseateles sp. BYS87W]|uniref:ABC transporter substrate-binding protein n=1 Tax=Pelomonas baiyunensis TaxID=3299026 RepID=A0ABW7H2C6_9BURK
MRSVCLLAAWGLAFTVAASAKTLTVCTEASPDGFDYALFHANSTADASSEALYNRLVEFEPGGTRLVPGLAERWELSADGKTYTFHLRAGVAFHTTPWFKPTRPLAAQDVVFSVMRQIDPQHPWFHQPRQGWYYAGAMQLAGLVRSVTAVDARTVKFELTRPEAPFLANLAMGFLSVVSAEYAQQLQAAGRMDDLNLKPVGTGPFQLRSYVKDAVVRYDAHPGYFRGKVALDKLLFSISPDPATRLQRLKAGECDIGLYPMPQTWDEIRRDTRLRLLMGPGLVTSFVGLNVEHKPLDDRRVRQALVLATDRATIARAVYGGAAEPAGNPFPPSQWGYDTKAPPTLPNLARARELLKAAGVPEGFPLKLWIRAGAGATNPNPRATAELLQADWARIGVKVEIVTLEFGELLKRTRAGEHDATLLAWASDNGDPDNFLTPNFACAAVAGGSNVARWCRKDFDALLAEAREVADGPKREALYRRAQALYRDDAPWVPLTYPTLAVATRANVVGMKVSPFGLNHYAGVDLK